MAAARFIPLHEDQLLLSLRQGLTALGLEPQSCSCAAYLQYLELLAKWNRAYNLTGVRDKRRMVHTHLLDSLAALPYVRGSRCLDIGTGAGLPGFILALAQPEVEWTLLDANGKKTRFLQQLVFELKTENVVIVHSRAEKFLSSAPYSSIISRAFGSLADYYRAVAHLLRPDTRLLALKGRPPVGELREVAALDVSVSVEPMQVPGIDTQRSMVIMQCACGLNKITA